MTERGPTARRPVVANGLVTVRVDPADGTFSVDGHGGLGRLVDGGDCGDTYNWCPPAADTVVDTPDAVEVAVLERGPVRARVLVVAPGTGGPPPRAWSGASARWPTRCARCSSCGPASGPSASRSTVDNRSRDHRLRAHFPLPSPAERSRAECAFGTVERGLVAEGGPTEAPLPTYPAQRFVQAGGLTVVHDGVAEYELVDIRDGAAHELALTLLRATGMLSQVPMPTRPLPAGPLVRLERLPAPDVGSSRRYVVAVGDGRPVRAGRRGAGAAAGGRGRRPTTAPACPAAAAAPDPADLPATGSALAVDGRRRVVGRAGGRGPGRAGVQPDRREPGPLDGRRGWLVDLRGRPSSRSRAFPLRAGGIATVRCRRAEHGNGPGSPRSGAQRAAPPAPSKSKREGGKKKKKKKRGMGGGGPNKKEHQGGEREQGKRDDPRRGPLPGRRLERADVLTQERRRAQGHPLELRSASGTAEGVPLTIDLESSTRDGAPLGRRRGLPVALRPRGPLLDVLRGRDRRELPAGRAGGRRQRAAVVHQHLPGAYRAAGRTSTSRSTPTSAEATSAGTPTATSQIALPEDACAAVYATTGYEQSVTNLSRTSLESDNVFGDDGASTSWRRCRRGRDGPTRG